MYTPDFYVYFYLLCYKVYLNSSKVQIIIDIILLQELSEFHIYLYIYLFYLRYMFFRIRQRPAQIIADDAGMMVKGLHV